jgi:outer membrane receptor for ferrienterochelin and colicin
LTVDLLGMGTGSPRPQNATQIYWRLPPSVARGAVSRFFSPCLVIVLGSLWALGFARSASATEEPKPALKEIIVTGSRIPVPANITATSPISVVTAQDIALAGHTDAINILNSLPQTIINSGIDFGNNSSPLAAPGGFATADLRGLGPQRTIVLVDGRRLGTGDPNTNNPNPAPDLDQIPVPLIDRVEVVTGGASATYGSDAVAGVVNFIMKRNFEGILSRRRSEQSLHPSFFSSALTPGIPFTAARLFEHPKAN